LPLKHLRKKRHFEGRICKICENIYFPSSANQKYCEDCRDKIIPYRKLKYRLGTCTKCGKKIEGLKRWCDNLKCQAHKEQYYKKRKTIVLAKNKKRAEQLNEDVENFKQIERGKRFANKKKCRICGGNPYPNILYCPSCFNGINVNVDSREFSLID